MAAAGNHGAHQGAVAWIAQRAMVEAIASMEPAFQQIEIGRGFDRAAEFVVIGIACIDHGHTDAGASGLGPYPGHVDVLESPAPFLEHWVVLGWADGVVVGGIVRPAFAGPKVGHGLAQQQGRGTAVQAGVGLFQTQGCGQLARQAEELAHRGCAVDIWQGEEEQPIALRIERRTDGWCGVGQQRGDLALHLGQSAGLGIDQLNREREGLIVSFSSQCGEVLQEQGCL